jgi:hypothetical protein
MKSEFGQGLTYCLGMFLAHERDGLFWAREQLGKRMSDYIVAESWFNGASDHLYQLQIPNNLPTALQKRLRMLKKKCIDWGHGYGIGGWNYGKPSTEKIKWALKEARDLLRLIDKFHGIITIKGSWE